MKASRAYAGGWWKQTTALMQERYGWEAGPNRAETGGWEISSNAAIADMAEAVQYELEDPDADPTLPLGEVLALVTVVNRELGAEATVEVPNDPDIAADIINQAVQNGFRHEEYRLAQL